MKKLCIAVLVFSTIVANEEKLQPSPLAQAIAKDADYFVQEYVAQLPTSVERDRLSNLLYYNYLTSITESAIRALIYSVRSQSSLLSQYDAQKDEQAFDVLTIIAARSEQIKRILPTHDWAIKRWHDCLDIIEKDGSPALKRAVDALQHYGQLVLQECIAQLSPQFETLLHREADTLKGLHDYLSPLQNSFQALCNQPQRNDIDPLRSIRTLNDAMVLSNNFLLNLTTVEETTSTIKNMSIDLINLNSVIFFEFYQAVFQKYQPLYCIFDHEGNMCCDSQKALPNLLTVNEELV